MSREPRLLPIHIYGDAVLRQKSEDVSAIDEELHDYAADLILTMYHRDGVGLAAPQTGVSKRMLVIDPYWSREGKPKDPIVMINPVIESSGGQTETEEGCISLPGLYAYVTRPAEITVSYSDLQGQRQKLSLKDYPAVVVQHEYDHLEGILFVDHLGTIARLKLKRRLKELESAAVDGINIRQDG